jgi:hypothetical protein
LADGQARHSAEEFYAGSLWKVSVQAFSDEDPKVWLGLLNSELVSERFIKAPGLVTQPLNAEMCVISLVSNKLLPNA